MNDTVKGASWVDLFKNYGNLTRLLIFFLVLALLTLSTAWLLVYLTHPNTITFDEHGTLRIEGVGQPVQYVVLLPASQCWMNTGIPVRAGEDVRVQSSGRIHLSIYRLVQAAQQGANTFHNTWVDPDGEIDTNMNELDRARHHMLIAPTNPIGTVLAYVGSDTPSCTNARPKGLVAIGKDKTIQGEGILWLTVNDMILENTQENEDAYVTTPDILKATNYLNSEKKPYTKELLTDRWKRYIADGRSDAFFQDNLGEFLVHVDRKKD